ncbi:universal stress protein [Wenyingzhuangia sp. IMCC45533]
MKNIIIPVDFSIYSENALKVAAMLAKKHGYGLTLIHMLELPSGYSEHDSTYAKSIVFMLKFAEQKMNTFVEKDYLEGITIKVIIKHFALFPEIGPIAEENNSSLIVMGSHGKDYQNGEYLGSNTEKVVKNSKIPVLVIKNELKDIDFSKSIFVSDFKLESAKAYVNAKKFFNEIGVVPKLLFINKPGSGFVSTKEMDTRFKEFLMETEGSLASLDSFENYDDYTVVDGVNSYIEDHGTSLLAVATHGKSNISKFFTDSVSLDLANETVLPVLTVLI